MRLIPTKRLDLLIALAIFQTTAAVAAPVSLTDQKPTAITQPRKGVFLVDFGKAAFANISLKAPGGDKLKVTVHFGEDLVKGRINRKPRGSVRYEKKTITLPARKITRVAPKPNKRNTQTDSKRIPPAILTPKDWGVVLPFRWVEIEGWPGKLTADDITRHAGFLTAWDDDAASFESSDKLLNRIWDLCKYSIKATTFAGVYVDGDRERIPYEADAYLNQLSHYYTDSSSLIARDTLDHLLVHSTWPTEWAPHLVFMAQADFMRTGDVAWLKKRYPKLKTKALLERVAKDGLVASGKQDIKRTDIVDWPRKERDGYVFTKRNTVVNAFHLAALRDLAGMAKAIGKKDDAAEYEAMFTRAHRAFQKQLFDAKKGIYGDGVGTKHSSLHANLFPLAFDLVPEEHIPTVVRFLEGKGMDCSVYAAQYLLEGLFENGAAQKAMDLIVAKNDRSWRHMVNSGTTITWEAWDQKYKPNQDWNHAWGAAPANLFPRYLLGAQALTPGWGVASIAPHPVGLKFAKGKIPTSKGAIKIHWLAGETFKLRLEMPNGMPAQVSLPANDKNQRVFVNGEKVAARFQNGRLVLEERITGQANLEVR